MICTPLASISLKLFNVLNKKSASSHAPTTKLNQISFQINFKLPPSASPINKPNTNLPMDLNLKLSSTPEIESWNMISALMLVLTEKNYKRQISSSSSPRCMQISWRKSNCFWWKLSVTLFPSPSSSFVEGNLRIKNQKPMPQKTLCSMSTLFIDKQ